MDESTLASTADRERVVARLADAHVDGRLTVEELEALTGAAHSARTVSELERVVANLPAAPAVPAAAVAERPSGAVVAHPGPYTGGQIAGATALTVILPAGRLIGLVVALSMMRGELVPERRRLLRVWATTCAVLLTIEVLAVLIFVVHI
jgi:Domain of unknown function (DUF1707)